MSKHTNGPWKATISDVLEEVTVVSDKAIIASIFRQKVGWPCKEHEANARLIAAAPEMLNVLKELERLYELLGTTDDFKTRVSAIIAKAEGRK